MKLVLFDIDGTLLWTDGAGRRAIHRALLDETGTAGPIETYRFDGKTDPQIVRELLALAGHPGATDDARIAAVCRRYVELLSVELAKPARATRLMVGIAELLAALEPHERAGRACVGLLTGNLAPGAAALTGRTFAGEDVVIVGDTPEDVACGRPIGARALAVATGFYDVAALRAAGAARVFATLVDTDAVLDAIFA